MKPGDKFKLKVNSRIIWLVFGVYRDSGITAVRTDSEMGKKLLAWIADGSDINNLPATRAEIAAVEKQFWHRDDLILV